MEGGARRETHGAIFVFEFLDTGQEFDGLIQVLAESEIERDTPFVAVKDVLEGAVVFGSSSGRSRGSIRSFAFSNG